MGGACGEARQSAGPEPESTTRSLHPVGKAEGPSGTQDLSFATPPGEESVRLLSRPRGLREPVGGILRPGWLAGSPAKHPPPQQRAPSQESSGSLGLGLGLGFPGPWARQQRRLLASVGNFTQGRPFPP